MKEVKIENGMLPQITIRIYPSGDIYISQWVSSKGRWQSVAIDGIAKEEIIKQLQSPNH